MGANILTPNVNRQTMYGYYGNYLSRYDCPKSFGTLQIASMRQVH